MNKKMDNKGFSLVELIIVIAIMAILVGVLAPQFIKYIESSRQSTDISAASEYKSAVEAYVADHGEAVSTNIEVKIDGNKMWATVNLTDVGLANSDGSSGATKLKSSGWGNSSTTIGTYNVTSFKWNYTTTNNTKDPRKCLGDAFK